MLKILYAADNRISSFYSLKRFVDTYTNFYTIKTAAYSKSIIDISVNWTLDALLDFRGKNHNISSSNSNFNLYIREIKKYAPNIIISDMELYSSYIGLEIGIPVWQVSPLLLYYGTTEHHNIYRTHSSLFTSNDRYVKYILNKSDKKLILSHLGDMGTAPKLKPGYDWVRPNYLDQKSLDKNNAIGLADSYFSGNSSRVDIDYGDPESIVVNAFNYSRGLSHTERQIKINTEINPNISFLSQYLSSVVI